MRQPVPALWHASGKTIVAVCIAAVIAGSPASVAAATPSWTIVPSPNPIGGGILSDVTCVGVSDCWAVGYDNSGHTLIERNPGSGWVIVTSPNPADSLSSSLSAVTCVTTSDCWTVGSYNISSSGGCCVSKTLIEQYNGSSWTMVSSPSPGTDINELRGVACVNANKCWAFGDYYTFTAGIEQAFIEQFSGGSWAVVGNGVSKAFLGRATCLTSLIDCWVVGTSFGPPACTSTTECTLIEHNTGNGWIIVPSPNVPTAADNGLGGVTCVSAGNCWAVGAYVNSVGGVATLTEHYDGSGWTIVPSPNAPKGRSYLSDVSCASATDCWAVGEHGRFPSSPRTLIEHYTGGAWVIVKSASASTQSNNLSGVKCVRIRVCWAVGSFRDTASSVTKTLIEHHQ